MKQVAVIGSGPAGLMSIFSLVEEGITSITLFEMRDKIGQRILVSGNGRCNFFHDPIDFSAYNDEEFASLYMSDFIKVKDEVFKKLGIKYYKDQEGRVYPITDSSKTIVKLFLNYLKKHNVKIRLNSKITSILKRKRGMQLCINDQYEYFDEVVLASGGLSYNYDESEKLDFYNKLNLDLSSFDPSLTPIITERYKNKRLEGKRFKVLLSLYNKDKLCHQEEGEILFKKDGISGIVTFNMSSFLARLHLKKYDGYSLIIDFAPSFSKDALKEIFNDKSFTLEEHLEQLFIEELKDELLIQVSLGKDLLTCIKAYTLKVKDLYPFSSSQVTSGGIKRTSLEDGYIKDIPNLYPAGEILDIDGLCGGYNIAFCLASGYYVGKKIAQKINKN